MKRKLYAECNINNANLIIINKKIIIIKFYFGTNPETAKIMLYTSYCRVMLTNQYVTCIGRFILSISALDSWYKFFIHQAKMFFLRLLLYL